MKLKKENLRVHVAHLIADPLKSISYVDSLKIFFEYASFEELLLKTLKNDVLKHL